MVSEKPIRERAIEIAQAVIEEEFAAVCAEDGREGAEAPPALRLMLDGIGDCRGFAKMSDRQIRAEVAPQLRKLVRDLLASRRPS